MTCHGEKYTLAKTVLSTLEENTVILSLLGVGVMDQPVKIALILEMAVVPSGPIATCWRGWRLGFPPWHKLTLSLAVLHEATDKRR